MIELKHIKKTYGTGGVHVDALNDLSLTISEGEFVAIMGPSGSGKSTLMHVLGLLDKPDSGSYFFGDRDLAALPHEKLAVIRNSLVGFVFQQFHLLSNMTALENAELPLIYAGKRHLNQKAKEKIKLVGLENRQLHKPNEMSGGQQQRVAIARALVNNPAIILADEPTGNLDSKSQEEILSILEKLHEEGNTIVVVTHEKEIADRADRIIYMLDGSIVSDTSKEEKRKKKSHDEKTRKVNGFMSKHVDAVGQAKFIDYLREAFFAIASHKMRSMLSILGILIGVAAVIAMLAIGAGAKDSIEKRLASLGSNLLMVAPGSSQFHGVSTEGSAVPRFTFQDVDAINKLPDVKQVSAYVSGRSQFVYANKNWNSQIIGVDVSYADMRASIPEIGRFFTHEEVKMRTRVVVLGATVARELFENENPIGKTVKINLTDFTVIGIAPPKGGGGFRDQDDIALIPVTTAMYRLFGKKYIDIIFVEGRTPAVLEPLIEKIKELVRKRHRIADNNTEAVSVWNMSDIRETLESTTQTMSLLLGTIAAISLIVGGIGIMNIMLVSVTERTREIGLRKALGAQNRDIMTQFLIETILMSFLGGILGILLGIGASILITYSTGWEVIVSPFSIILATTFSVVIGVSFGMWPARQASKLDPIKALRYE